MRLIDADACPCNTCRTQCCENPRRCTFFGLWLLRQAYDVEKVVAELEYQKEQCEKDMKYYEEKSWKDNISHTNYDLFFAKSDCWEDAIDIVKTGGV